MKIKQKKWFVFVDVFGIVENCEGEIIVFSTIEDAKETQKQIKENFPDFDAKIAKLNAEVVQLVGYAERS